MDENKVPMENTASQPRKKGKLILAACAVLLVAAIVIGCVSAVMAADPIKQVEDAFANNMKAAVPQKEGKIQKMVKDGGSLEVAWDADLLMADLVGLPLDVDAIVKIFADYEAQKSAVTANVNFSGMSLLDAVMTYDSNRYAVSSKALLGDKAYGVDLSTLGETFPNSALAKLVDIDLEGFAEQYAAVLANQANMPQAQKELQKELIKLYRDTWNTLKASLKEHAVTEKGNTELRIGAKSEAVPVTAVTITADAMRFLNICEDMLLFFRGNETVDVVIEGFNIHFSGMNAEETKAELRLMIEKALAEIKELQESEDADASGSVSATVFISKAKKEIIRVDFAVQDTSEEVLSVALVCGPSMDALTEISLTTSGLDEDVSICYLVDENSETAYSAVLTVMDETLFTVSVDKATEFVKAQLNVDGEEIVFTADKDGDAFRASLLAGGEEFGLNGSFIDTEEQYGLAFETVDYNGETIRLGKLSVVWNTEDEMPVIESFTDIMTMSEEELEALVQQVETAIQTLASAFVG